MKTLPLYQLDAFTSEVFGGNPAAVMPLEEWLPDDIMQNLALENNLSETAFLLPYWTERLGKTTLLAKQVSARGGVLRCELKGDRVAIAGEAAFYMEGSVHLC